MKPSTELLKARELDFFLKTAVDGDCVVWTGYCDDDGYGYFQFSHEGRKYSIRAHRAAFLLGGGVLTDAPLLRHSCNRPPCVRFEHLLLGTHAANVADRVRAGRSAKGEANGRSKLCDRDVVAILRLLEGGVMTKTQLAQHYGVDCKVIRLIERREIWVG